MMPGIGRTSSPSPVLVMLQRSTLKGLAFKTTLVSYHGYRRSQEHECVGTHRMSFAESQ